MATLTVRNLEDDLVRRLRMRAAAHGRSAEAEHREILRSALSVEDQLAARRDISARLSAFRERTSGRGGPSTAELLAEARGDRLRALTGDSGST